jgi:uncharacterized membrane protein
LLEVGEMSGFRDRLERSVVAMLLLVNARLSSGL